MRVTTGSSGCGCSSCRSAKSTSSALRREFEWALALSATNDASPFWTALHIAQALEDRGISVIATDFREPRAFSIVLASRSTPNLTFGSATGDVVSSWPPKWNAVVSNDDHGMPIVAFAATDIPLTRPPHLPPIPPDLPWDKEDEWLNKHWCGSAQCGATVSETPTAKCIDRQAYLDKRYRRKWQKEKKEPFRGGERAVHRASLDACAKAVAEASKECKKKAPVCTCQMNTLESEPRVTVVEVKRKGGTCTYKVTCEYVGVCRV